MAHALFEGRHAEFDQPRRRHRLFHAAGEIVQAAGQPAFGRPARRRGRLARQHAIAELGRGDALRQVRLAVAQRFRQANRDRLFERSAARRRQTKPTGGVPLHRRRRRELRLHHHRLGAPRAHGDVRAERTVLLEHAALLHAQGLAPERMLGAQRLAERGVDGGLAVQRHGGFQVDSLSGRRSRRMAESWDRAVPEPRRTGLRRRAAALVVVGNDMYDIDKRPASLDGKLRG